MIHNRQDFSVKYRIVLEYLSCTEPEGYALDNMNNYNNNSKLCSFCGEEIRADIKRCPYCGSLLEIKVDEIRFETYESETGKFQSDTIEEPDSETIADFDKETSEHGNDVYETINPAYRMQRPVVKPLSNGMKVFLTALSAVIPGIGQLAGIIIAIVFMNTEDDADRKSFGVALLIASLVVFIFSCMYCLIMVMALGATKQ